MAIRSSNKISPSFNMASLTDMVFLLLIFFMITSTMVSPNALKLLLPQSNNQTQAKASTTVSITEDLRFFVETTPVALVDIERQLQLKLMDTPEPTIALYVHRTVAMEEVVKVMNIAARNKYRLILATAPERNR